MILRSLVLASAKLPAGIFLPVPRMVGCSIQAWAANKSQLPSLDMGNAEQSCCFLDDLGLLLLPRNSQVQAVWAWSSQAP